LEQKGVLLKLLVCTAVTRGNKTNKAVIEMISPSGFEFVDTKLDSLKDKQTIKKWELFDSNSRAYLYLDSLDKSRTCLTLLAVRTNLVANLAGCFAKVYDYYDTKRNAETFYSLGSSVQERRLA